MNPRLVECTAARLEAERLIEEALETGATSLSLAGLRIDVLPPRFKAVAGQLKTLDLSGCYRLVDLEPLREAVALTRFDMSRCGWITSLAPLANLSTLQSLDISQCYQLANLEPLAYLSKLQSLDLSYRGQPTSLELLVGLSMLRDLKLSGCDELTSLQQLADLPALHCLDLSRCSQLTSLAPLAGLSTLQTLNLSECKQLSDLASLDDLSTLQSLDLSGCDQFTSLAPLAGLLSLKRLGLGDCAQLTNLEPLAGLSAMQSLDLSSCSQLTDLKPLASFSALQSLDLSNCSQLTDLEPLASLSALQILDLHWCQSLTNLKPLAGLSSLQRLDLSGCFQLTSLEHLANLPALQDLDLSTCGQITSLSPLVNLSELEALTLRECNQLVNLEPLSGLSALKSLDLSWATQITSLEPLANLSSLQSLHIEACYQLTCLKPLTNLSALQSLDLSRCRRITSLEPLAGLTALQKLHLNDCNQITSLEPLAGLTMLRTLSLNGCDWLTNLTPLIGFSSLQDLDLSNCHHLTSLEPLASLTGLQNLSLSGCHQITSLEPLADLIALHTLNINHLRGRTINFKSPLQLKQLQKIQCNGTNLDLRKPSRLFQDFARLLSLTASQFCGAPRELGSDFSNCLPILDAWHSDLSSSGATPLNEIKLFILGNGSAGKTQIVRRLRHEDFDPAIPSTHGIAISRFPLLRAKAEHGDIFAKVWDFGGQDIYLGTHSLFLDDRAIYMLVWTPEKENDDEFEEAGVQIRNHRLDYWLDYVRSLVGTQAPIIVVQAQCDEESQKREPPLPATPEFKWIKRDVSCSAANAENGMEELWPVLRKAARLLQERHGEVMLPASWTAVGDELRQLQEQGRKVLPYPEFLTLCEQRDIGAPQTTLEYLHGSGAVFHAADVFGGDVVLDQAWALDGVYAVLHRASVLPVLKANKGRFTRELLGGLLWDGQYSVEDQDHFISLMQSCQVCFEIVKGDYITPDCLPERSEVVHSINAVWRGSEPDAKAELRYDFLHDGIKRGLLCALGTAAGLDAVYWRHGVCFYDTRAGVTVLVECQQNSNGRKGAIGIEVSGPEAQRYASTLLEAIRSGIRTGQTPAMALSIGCAIETNEALSLPAVESREERPFAHVQAGLRPSTPNGALPIVHVSYAWNVCDAFVDRLGDLLKGECDWRRDREQMRPGDWISRFMDEIGLSACVVVVISDKYLKSDYCMRELLSLWRSSRSDKVQMLERIVPVVMPDARLDDDLERLGRARYWKHREQQLREAAADLDLAAGDSTRAKLLRIGEFKHHVVDMLDWIADVLMPRAGQGHDEPVLEAVVELVRRRLAAASA